MFCVQEKRRLVGLDTAYSVRRCWLDSANEETIYDDDEGFTAPPQGDQWEEFGYIDQWFTVMVAFTEEGCKEYLRLDGHNLKETRIYVESFNRCPEMIAIREALIKEKIDPDWQDKLELGFLRSQAAFYRSQPGDLASMSGLSRLAELEKKFGTKK